MSSDQRWTIGNACPWNPNRPVAVLSVLLILFLLLCNTVLLASTGAASGSRELKAARQGAVATVPAGQTTTRPTSTRPADRAAAVRKLAARVGIREGSVVADIGAGNGQDSWVFAEIVGLSGTVYAEEITDKLVKSLESKAAEKRLPQLKAVLGQVDNPSRIEAVDLAYMRYVYHHFSKPREMLRGIWRAMKPGGYFVVIDRELGTLKDWTPREERTEKHHWLAETTVAREAREEGFRFVACAEECCESSEPFVLIFQRPVSGGQPAGDPDPFLPLPMREASKQFVPLSHPYERPVFIALGQARELMAPIMRQSTGPGLDIVLEEWATQKNERPPLPAGLSMPSVLTENSDPHLGGEPIDAVFFLDSFHLLFHGETLLARLHEKLRSNGCVYVLDREASLPLTRRMASHCKRIDPGLVREEMAAAGFSLWFEGPRLAPDRFLQVYGKNKPADIRPEDDPFVGGPAIDRSPGEWFRDNLWHLRGLKTADGRYFPLPTMTLQLSVEKGTAEAADMETWRLPSARLELVLKKADKGYLLVDCRPSGKQE